jgi:hypothetical protein
MRRYKSYSSIYGLVMVCTILLTLSACKKDDNTPSTLLAGTWLDTQVNTATGSRYLVLDNSHSAITLNAALGIHIRYSSVYSATSDQITVAINASSTSLYSYKISGDTLYLNQSGMVSTYKKTTPVDPTTWVKPLTLSQDVSFTNTNLVGLTDYLGTKLVVASLFNTTIYQIAPGAATPSDSVDIGVKMRGIAVTGANTWVSKETDKKLHRIDWATGSDLSASKVAPSTIRALATLDADHILAFSDNGLLEYTISTDSWVNRSTLLAEAGAYGFFDMVAQGGYLYVSTFIGVAKINLSNYLVEDTYAPSSFIPVGLAYDGTSFSALSVDGLSSGYKVFFSKIQF